MRRTTMQTKSSRIRIAALVMAGLGLIALTAFILNSNNIQHVLSSKVAANHAAMTKAPLQAPPKNAAEWSQAMSKSPLSFQANEGQTDAQVRYMAHGAGYELFLTDQEAVVTLRQPVAKKDWREARIHGMRERVRAT